jgi:rhodanese-related sulfurtransferase
VVFDLATFSTRRVLTRRNPDCRHEGLSARSPRAARPLELEFESLDAALASGLELVDIREHWERDGDPAAALIGRHVALSELMQGQVEWPGEGRWLVVCAHGVRSLALAERLREMGYAEVYSMRGGLAALTA